MLESVNEFLSNNSTLILIGLVAIVALVGFIMYRRSSNANGSISTPIPTPSHDLEGMDNLNMVCDLANGVCMPHQMQQQMTEEVNMGTPEMNIPDNANVDTQQ
jgi:LPXTG-motif cell wall-anchored protein